MARFMKAVRTLRRVFPRVQWHPYCTAATGDVGSSATATEDFASNVVVATHFASNVVTVETYHKDWFKFLSICITRAVLSTTANQYMTNKQIEGLESKIEGTNKRIGGLEGKIEGLTKIQEAQDMLLRDIRRNIQELKVNSNAKFAELKVVLEQKWW